MQLQIYTSMTDVVFFCCSVCLYQPLYTNWCSKCLLSIYRGCAYLCYSGGHLLSVSNTRGWRFSLLQCRNMRAPVCFLNGIKIMLYLSKPVILTILSRMKCKENKWTNIKMIRYIKFSRWTDHAVNSWYIKFSRWTDHAVNSSSWCMKRAYCISQICILQEINNSILFYMTWRTFQCVTYCINYFKLF